MCVTGGGGGCSGVCSRWMTVTKIAFFLNEREIIEDIVRDKDYSKENTKNIIHANVTSEKEREQLNTFVSEFLKSRSIDVGNLSFFSILVVVGGGGCIAVFLLWVGH